MVATLSPPTEQPLQERRRAHQHHTDPDAGPASRVAVASVLALVLALALSACGAGRRRTPRSPYNPSLGSDALIGKICDQQRRRLTDGNIPELAAVIVNQSRLPDTLRRCRSPARRR